MTVVSEVKDSSGVERVIVVVEDKEFGTVVLLMVVESSVEMEVIGSVVSV